MIIINGEPAAAEGATVFDYLCQNGYDPKRVAVEKNGEILPKSAFDSTILSDGDVVEVVSFVGGG